MSEEEIMSMLRAIKAQLNNMEARLWSMDQRQQAIKQEVGQQPAVGSFASTTEP